VGGSRPAAGAAARTRPAPRRRRATAARPSHRRVGRAGRPAPASGQGAADAREHRPERQHLPRDAAPPLPGDRGGVMKAVRLHAYNKPPVVDEVPEPKIEGPFDVIVKIGGAGVCRTDLHIILGQWDAAMNPTLPYTIGHENAGW